MFTKALLISMVVCSALGQGYRPPTPQRYTPPQQPSYNSRSEEEYESPKYNFEWNVAEDSNNFRQEEQREDDNTKGSYVVDLPDGRRQIVSYYVDGESGFIADVKYEGEAQFDSNSNEYSAPSAPRPSYQTPRPTYSAPRTTRRPTYSAPRTTRRPTYSAPRTTRRPTYSAPRTTRRPTYSAPRTTPRPTYRAPKPAPRRSYNADSLRSAFGF